MEPLSLLGQLQELSQQFEELKVPEEELGELFLRTVGPEHAPRLVVEKRGIIQWFKRLFWSSQYKLAEGSRTALHLEKLLHVATAEERLLRCKQRILKILETAREKKLMTAQERGGMAQIIALFRKMGLTTRPRNSLAQYKIDVDLTLEKIKSSLQGLSEGVPKEGNLGTIFEKAQEIEKDRSKIQHFHSMLLGIGAMQELRHETNKPKMQEQIDEMVKEATNEKNALFQQAEATLDRATLMLLSVLDVEALENTSYRNLTPTLDKLKVLVDLVKDEEMKKRAKSAFNKLREVQLKAKELEPQLIATLEAAKKAHRGAVRLQIVKSMLELYANIRKMQTEQLERAKMALEEARQKKVTPDLKKTVMDAVTFLQETDSGTTIPPVHMRKFREMMDPELIDSETIASIKRLIDEEKERARKMRPTPLEEIRQIQHELNNI